MRQMLDAFDSTLFSLCKGKVCRPVEHVRRTPSRKGGEERKRRITCSEYPWSSGQWLLPGKSTAGCRSVLLCVYLIIDAVRPRFQRGEIHCENDSLTCGVTRCCFQYLLGQGVFHGNPHHQPVKIFSSLACMRPNG